MTERSIRELLEEVIEKLDELRDHLGCKDKNTIQVTPVDIPELLEVKETQVILYMAITPEYDYDPDHWKLTINGTDAAGEDK